MNCFVIFCVSVLLKTFLPNEFLYNFLSNDSLHIGGENNLILILPLVPKQRTMAMHDCSPLKNIQYMSHPLDMFRDWFIEISYLLKS